jgi:hypothetical protein
LKPIPQDEIALESTQIKKTCFFAVVACRGRFHLNLAKGCALNHLTDEAELQRLKEIWTERHSLSAYQAAQPQ